MNLKRLGNVTHGASIPVGAIIVTPYVAFPLAFILGVHVFDDDAAFVDRCCPVADVGEPAPKIVAVPFLDIILVIIPDVFAALGGPDVSYLAPLPVLVGLAPDRQVLALLDGCRFGLWRRVNDLEGVDGRGEHEYYDYGRHSQVGHIAD